MIKKTLAIPSQTQVLESPLFSQLQGHCFGFSLYCLLRLQYPEHQILTNDVVVDSRSLQTRYDENKKNDGAIIVLPGLIERQGDVCAMTLTKVDTKWRINSFPEGLLDRGPCVFYFAVADGEEGHTVYLDPGGATGDAVICDTHDRFLQKTMPAHAVHAVMVQKITDYFLSQHENAVSGQILLQTICYEKTMG
jgi:hypothetical protein